jgi:hypothetical protein
LLRTYYKVRISHNLLCNSNDLSFPLEISEFNLNEDRRMVPLIKINLTKKFFPKKNLINKKKKKNYYFKNLNKNFSLYKFI